MKLNTIQKKISVTLIVVLLLSLGVSFSLTTLQSHSLLEDRQQKALESAHESALSQARTLFGTLEIGAKGSMEQGEMDLFRELLMDLGALPGVLEVGLTGPTGTIHYSNNKEKVGQHQVDMDLSSSGPQVSIEKESGEKLFLANGQMFEQYCLDCHDDGKVGALAGILYVDYSLEKLLREKKHQEESLAADTSKSLRNNVIMAVLSIMVTWLVLLFVLRKMIVVPVGQVKSVLNEIDLGHLDTRLHLTQQDELGDMARTLDTLSDSLQTEVVTPLEQLAAGDLTFRVIPRDKDDVLRRTIQQLGNDLNQ